MTLLITAVDKNICVMWHLLISLSVMSAVLSVISIEIISKVI